MQKIFLYTLLTALSLHQMGCVGDIRGEDGRSGILDILRYNKPGFQSDSFLDTQVNIFSTGNSTVDVVISDHIYSGDSNTSLNIENSGIGGVAESGTLVNQTLYVYATPSQTDTSRFEIFATRSAPSFGAENLNKTSYLGSFRTDSNSKVIPFIFLNNEIIFDRSVFNIIHNSNNVEPYILPVASHAHFIYGRLSFENITTFNGLAYAATDEHTITNAEIDPTNITFLYINVGSSNIDDSAIGWIPMTSFQTIFLYSNSVNNTVRFQIYGWKEDTSLFP